MLAGIREIAVITTRKDQGSFSHLLGDGSKLGMNFSFLVQDEPRGLVDAFILGAEFIGVEACALILGDNFFHGSRVGRQLAKNIEISGAKVFAQLVEDPTQYGVVEFDNGGRIISIEEKPTSPRSRFAIPGIYFYDNSVVEVAKTIRPSARGELEISDLNNHYLRNDLLVVEELPRGTVWFDTGTFSNLNDAANYVRLVQERQGMKVACLEEIAFRNGWIDKEQLLAIAEKVPQKEYRNYLVRLSETLSGQQD
jgi:glucose-1-phosphate thymidylyltransferase